jgi:hypothetical protein
MTTRLVPERPVRRVIDTARHGTLTCIMTVEGIYYRERGRKKSFLIPHGVAFQNAVSLHIARERADKKAARASRKRRS